MRVAPATLAALFVVAPATMHAQQTSPDAASPDTGTRASTTTRHPAPADGNALPVTRVSLYKNGVGFFEHTGHVSGNARVSIDFTSSQLNDVLQSLTAVDLNGGRIAGAGYNSTTPLEQQLRTLPLSLDVNTTAAAFYNSIRGSRVAVHTGAATITGRLLSVESGEAVAANSVSTEPTPKIVITVVSDGGDVRTLPITTTTDVHLLDPSLDASVGRYLKLLDSNRSQGLRHLTLEDRAPSNFSGVRDLHVSYISEVPVWKSTYRILFTDAANSGATQKATLQGWSVVDNTTGTDWLNVHLSLIAGAPQSFIQPLSQPIYAHRPEIAIAQEAQLQPQTFESGYSANASGSGLSGTVTDPTGASIPGSTITAINTATGARETRTSDGAGRFSINLPAGQYRLEASAPGFETMVQTNVNVTGQQISSIRVPLHVGSASATVEVTAAAPLLSTESASVAGMASARSVPNRYVARGPAPKVPPPPPQPPPSYEELATQSITANTQSSAFDDFFAYNLTEPVTICKNESALVPILQAKVDAERVTLVHAAGAAGSSMSEPLRALWITNTSGLTLDRGSFSIVENGNFGGEGLLDPIHANEKRLLSYAADQAIHVSTENTSTHNKVDLITASKGVITIQRAERSETTYVVHNAAAETRTVILEHPVESGYLLDATLKPEETTPTVYRFRLQAAAGATVRLPVASSHRDATTYALADADDDQLGLILRESGDNPKIASALAPILAARRRVADADAAVEQTNTLLEDLHANEDRERANIAALNSADRSARNRFVNDLNRTEDQIIATQKELDTRTAVQAGAEAELANRIQNLSLNEKL